ncbi:putative tartrate transporter [Rhodovastum atsumiense]|uniref:MFS transporter n=1 Tax=Rhodovastum atsumiense TaxID=504468 RepID=A0A5M6IZ31_9PROT|nr:MFS transporter [Rhodovastum atsumiense]KAA5613610.1 MFS transporter [Rhodovastum atsumiense]CAH2599514.1 putative tartrate transporter [Rhodovastum atsumiense]
MAESPALRHPVEPLERETIHRIAWRLIPLLMLGYFCAYLDRVNVGFAGLTMNRDLGFSATVFGFGAGIFFIGYFLAELPSNLILNRVGARVWIARILFTWGILSGLTAFVWDAWSFYIVRFLVGVAEAGFYPGVVLYLTWWFPSSYRTRMMALFQSASVISLIIGPIISAELLKLDGVSGLHGWQWLFLAEAVPPLVMCVVTLLLLTDRPRHATWLRPDQRDWLDGRLQAERAQRESIHRYELGEALRNPRVWWLTLVYFGQNVSNYGLLIFLPQIVKSFGVSTTMTGVLSALPFVFAAVAMLYWGWHSDRTGERTYHVAGACLLCAAGLAACVFIGFERPALMMVALILAAMGQQSIAPTFWSMPTALLSGTAAAGGIALINSVGNLGGFVGPYAFGLVRDATASDTIALLCLAAAPVVSAIVLVSLGHDRRLERIPSQAAIAE